MSHKKLYYTDINKYIVHKELIKKKKKQQQIPILLYFLYIFFYICKVGNWKQVAQELVVQLGRNYDVVIFKVYHQLKP